MGEKMRIGINLLDLHRHLGGAYQYAVTFVQHLLAYNRINQYILFYTHKDFLEEELNLTGVTLVEVSKRPKVGLKLGGGVVRPGTLLRAASALGVPLPVCFIQGRYTVFARWRLDLLIQPAHGFGAFFSGLPYIVSIHDCPYQWNKDMRKHRKSYDIWANNLHAKALASKAVAVLVDSEAGKEGLMRGYGIPAHKIYILSFRVPDYVSSDLDTTRLAVVKQKYELPDFYLFFPSVILPHKNHLGLLTALDILRHQYQLEVPLILVGARGVNGSFDKVMDRVRELNMSDQVRYLGYVPDEDMPSLYKLAGALVFPTFMGPTSIPIIEAFAAGCPVICSNVEGYGDQVGDAGILVDPTSPNDLAQAIYSVYTDRNLRERLIEKGRVRLNQLSSGDYGKRIFEIVQGVLENGQAVILCE